MAARAPAAPITPAPAPRSTWLTAVRPPSSPARTPDRGAVRSTSAVVPSALRAGGATFNFPAGLFQWSTGGLNLDGRTLTNLGTITLDNPQKRRHLRQRRVSRAVWASATRADRSSTRERSAKPVPSRSTLDDSIQLDNTESGTYDFTGDGGFVIGDDSPFITNSGLFEKTGGTNTSSLAVPFTNLGGTIDAGSGTLSLTDGGTLDGGTYNAGQGATLDLFAGQTFTCERNPHGLGGRNDRVSPPARSGDRRRRPHT